jgi:hypothetical protein
MVMARYFFTNKQLNPTIMEEELQKVITWEKQKFGYFEDTTVEEVVKVLQDYFGLQAEVSTDVSIDNIKVN